MTQTTDLESGILLVDKPVGWTSHDVVNCVRKRFDIRKVGHCGTLDPNATGLLVLVLGKATRLSSQLSPQDKSYTGSMYLGVTTTSQDYQGDIVDERPLTEITPEHIRAVSAEFTGDIEQIPPMVSAKKSGGKRLYKMAREGKTVEREPRRVTIYELAINEIDLPYVHFEVYCSKGTYIRTLVADIGERLGCGSYLYALRRLKSGPFSVDNAYTTDTIKSWEREDLLNAKIDMSQAPMYLS